jgi:hypothetical protein
MVSTYGVYFIARLIRKQMKRCWGDLLVALSTNHKRILYISLGDQRAAPTIIA